MTADLELYSESDGVTIERRIIYEGEQYVVTFPNGYAGSVVRHKYSYGSAAGLWELAVLVDGFPCYDTPITSDVIGCLTASAVVDVLQQIEKLPPRS